SSAGNAVKALIPMSSSRNRPVESTNAWFKARIVKSRSITRSGVGRLSKTASKSGFAGRVTVQLPGWHMRPLRVFLRNNVIRRALSYQPGKANQKDGQKPLSGKRTAPTETDLKSCIAAPGKKSAPLTNEECRWLHRNVACQGGFFPLLARR